MVEEDEEDADAPVAKGKKVVDVAGTKADDEIRFDEESGSEEDDEDSDDESGGDEEEEADTSRAEPLEAQYEMSATRANKELAGTTFAEIAMTKVRRPPFLQVLRSVLTAFSPADPHARRLCQDQ